MPEYAIVVDYVDAEEGKWIGFRTEGGDFPIWIGRMEVGPRWLCTGGVSDEYSGRGSTPAVALRRMAKEAGITGTALMHHECTSNREDVINL